MHEKNADVGDENGGGADGNEDDENTNPNDASRTNTFRRDSLHCFEVVEDAGEALYGFTVWNDLAASTIGAVAPAEIDANDDPLVDVLLAPLLEDDGVAPQPVGATCTMAPAAHEGVAQPARAHLPRAPPLAAQAAPAAPSERAPGHSDSDEVAELSNSRLSCLYIPPFSPGVGLRGAPSEGKGETTRGEPYVARCHPEMRHRAVTFLWLWLAQYPPCGRVFRTPRGVTAWRQS